MDVYSGTVVTVIRVMALYQHMLTGAQPEESVFLQRTELNTGPTQDRGSTTSGFVVAISINSS